jgi:hypothetical protein
MLATLVVAIALGCASAGSAAVGGVTVTRTHNHVTCTWRTELGGSSSCQKRDRTGFIVITSQRLVMVQTAKAKVRFWRNQPTHSVGYGSLNDKRITVTETHNSVTCAWTSLRGGGAFCNKANRHGYVAGLTQSVVLVANEQSKVVYLVNQP